MFVLFYKMLPFIWSESLNMTYFLDGLNYNSSSGGDKLEKKTIAIYCRIDGPITELSGDFLEMQQKQLLRYANLHQLCVTEYYCDLGYSGLDLERPGLYSLCSGMEKNKFQYILVSKLDRLFRGKPPDNLQYLLERMITAEPDFVGKK